MKYKSIERVAIVIPNLNGADYICAAIDSLLGQEYAASIIVIENASTDGSLELLKGYGDKITILKNNKNLGFAGGVNVGIRYALDTGFQAVALFNNDAVADREWLANLVKTMNRHPKAGIVTCKITLGSGELLDSTGEYYTTWGLPFPRGRGKPVDLYVQEEEVFGASGGASLYNSDMLHTIGLFDDRFFAYYEDTDISFRAQLYGWRVYYTPEAMVSHRQGATSKKMAGGFTVHQTIKNLPMLFLKNIPARLLPKVGCRFALAYTLILLKALFSRNSWPALKGFLLMVALLPHTILMRYRIQRNKRVSGRYINSILIHDLPPDQTGLRKVRKVFMGK